MNTLEDLKKSLLSMSPEEKMAKLREVRDDRKVSKHATTVKAKSKQDKSDKVVGKFHELSPEEQEELIKALKS